MDGGGGGEYSYVSWKADFQLHCFRKNTLGESSSTTLSNSIPGIRHKEPHYPLDKYLPRAPKRDETFIKSREIPLRKDVSLFRKIESLLKESQCIREPIVNCVLAPNEAHVNVSSESSISTEDIVAAEFYKATYGTPKKVDFNSKPKCSVPAANRGAGDWVDVRSPRRCSLGPQPQIEEGCQAPNAMSLPWNGHNRISALSPKTVHTETYFHPASLRTFESFGHCHMSNEYGINMDNNREEGKLNDSEKSPVKPKVSEACSFSSVPSVSIQTSASRLPNKNRTLKKVSVQNACINTDRVNTHVFNMKHSDPDVVDDFASQNRIKACVVQELPKVNIRACLVRQSCGFVSINPVHVPNEIQNTAVVELSHYNNQTEQPTGCNVSNAVSYSPKGQTVQNVHSSLNNVLPDKRNSINQPQRSSENAIPDAICQPALSHRLAFDMGLQSSSRQGPVSDHHMKPKIFGTVSHFKEQLSRDFNDGFESIKKSLSEMVSSLNEFCDIGLNNVQGLRNVSSTSKTNPLTLHERVDRMDGILTEELRKWGKRDLAHYTLLSKAIDELTNEIKTAVESFHQQQHLNERTNAFLEDSNTSFPHQRRVTDQKDLKATRPPEPLRIDKLYAIHSYLQQNQPPATESMEPRPNYRSDGQPCSNLNKGENFSSIKTKFDETFTIDPSPPDEGPITNIERSLAEKNTTPQIEDTNDKEEIRGDYEDDFMPEDQEDELDVQLSDSDSTGPKSDSSRSVRTAGDVVASKTDDNLVVQVRTSGSGNGEESADAPLVQIVHEEPPSSMASTVNASHAHLKSRVNSCTVHKSIPIQTVPVTCVQTTMKTADDNSDKPLVRLTNKNTNAVFELRLPEKLENLNSTLTYNSVGCNDSIKLSFGCLGLKAKAHSADPQNVPVDYDAASDKKAVQDELHMRDASSHSKQIFNSGLTRTINAGGVMQNSRHIQYPPSSLGQRGCVNTETFPPAVPRVTLRNQATQFPTVEMESVERLSASILTLFESKMNDIVETNKQKAMSNEVKFRDFSVQVVLGTELGEQLIGSLVSGVANPAVTVAQGLSSTNFHSPGNAKQIPQRTPVITPSESDGYDSHPKNLEKPTDYLVLKQTEREVEKLLTQNSKYPVQLETSFSSVSVPSSLSEFPAKSDSTSSSELAYPLDLVLDPAPFENLHRLHPAPEFDYGNVVDTSNDKQEEPVNEEIESHNNSLGDISSHLNPNPEDLTGLRPCVELEEEKEANEAAVGVTSVVDEAKPLQTCIYDVQPYDSDQMSEGEVGYVYTSNSYSSGEIVERRRPGAAAITTEPPLRTDGNECSGDGLDESAARSRHIEKRSTVLDLGADDSSRLIEECSTSETTTSETT